MHKSLTLTAVCALAATASAQIPQTLVFTGRFDFTGADVANERTGGSINQLSEFSLSTFTPGFSNSAVAREPAVSHQAWMGDAYGDGNYVRLEGFKTTFERFNFAGPFIKDADKSSGDITKVFWTVRDQVPKNFTVLNNTGANTEVIAPGDFFRFTPNGNVEFFIRQADFAVAQGPVPTGQSGADGASAMCQDAQGNIYYTPAEGGHWVNGNSSGQVFIFDGGICMIPASAITYDAAGNVASVQQSSAIALFQETGGSPGPGPNIRDMVERAGANLNDGSPLLPVSGTSPTANMVGLELDPNGGTINASFPSRAGTFDPVPNFIYTFDNGTWAGSIFSTRDTTGLGPGSIAVINGVKCGEDAPGVVPDPTAWLGCTLDPANFSPTMMGIALMDIAADPLVANMPNTGELTQGLANWEIDFKGLPLTPIFMLTQPGPGSPNQFAQVFAVSSLGLPAGLLAPGSYPYAFVWPTPTSSALLVTDSFGYATYTVPNPWNSVFLGATVEVQGVALLQSTIRISNPVQVQLR